jgi:hypothetical protein
MRNVAIAVLAVVAALVLASGCGSNDPVATSTGGDRAVGDDAGASDQAARTIDSGSATDERGERSDDPAMAATANDSADRSSLPASTPVATTPPLAVPPPGSTPTAVPTPTPRPFERPPAPNGRLAPIVADSAQGLAEQIIAAERGLADPASSPAEKADWGHLHQVAIRKLGYEPGWDVAVFEALPPELRARTLLHLSARRALIDLSSGYDAADFVPAWQIIEPEPAEALLGYYQEAESTTGIEWEYLAAINLIETGMGRIRGLSSAGAQGPMQFLPSTWNESGIGAGDINDAHDAIQGAARYLLRRGGPADMPGAIWGYNNHDLYVAAVTAYAEALRQDPAAYDAIYNWEIYFHTKAGDVWLPVGFVAPESIDLDDFLAANPWSAPDPGLG